MLRTLRQVRLAMSARSLAAIALSLAVVSVVTAGGSARAAGACPDPFVEATVNIDGAVGPGCRAIFTPYEADGSLAGERYLQVPAGTGNLRARVLAVGGGQSGSLMIASGPLDGDGLPTSTPGPGPRLGGAGGGGGEVKQEMLDLEPCRRGQIGVGRGGQASALQQNFPDSNIGTGAPQALGGDTLFELLGNRFEARGADTKPAEVYFIYGAETFRVFPGGYSGKFGGNPGGATTLGGGGGGASVDHAGGDASASSGWSYTAGPPASATGTGGAGGAGMDLSALFPGLAGADRLGAGGGGFGLSVAGAASPGGGAGGTIDWTSKVAIPATSGQYGGGGGGGFEAGAATSHGGTRWFFASPGNGGDGILVVDIRVPDASASCTFVPKAPGGSKPGGGSAAASIKASPKVSATQVPAGGTVTVTLSARNAGTTAAKKARIVFPAPAGFAIVRAPGAKVANGRAATWSVGTLKPRATVKRTVVLQASADAIGRKRIRFSVVSSLGTTNAKAASVWVTGPSSVTG